MTLPITNDHLPANHQDIDNIPAYPEASVSPKGADTFIQGSVSPDAFTEIGHTDPVELVDEDADEREVNRKALKVRRTKLKRKLENERSKAKNKRSDIS